MEIIIDASQFLIWYVLLGIGIIAICLWATWKHQTFAPITWGIVVTALIFYFEKQIAPLVFGVLNYDWSTNPLMFILTGTFSLMFFAYIALVLWNLYVSGEAIE